MNEACSVEEGLEDHLRLRLDGNLEEDLQRNYDNEVVLLTENSNARGHDADRRVFQSIQYGLLEDR